jgi:HEAT repeat protein
VVEVLGALGLDAGVEPLRKVIESTLAPPPGPIPPGEVVGGLSAYAEPEVIERLVRLLRTDERLEVRNASALALGRMHHRRCFSLLVDASERYRDEPDDLVAVVVALGELGDPRAVRVLSRTWWMPSDREVVEAKIEALGRIRHRDSVEALIELLTLTGGDPLEAYDGRILFALCSLTGEEFGRDAMVWKNWWVRNHRTFRIPDAAGPGR